VRVQAALIEEHRVSGRAPAAATCGSKRLAAVGVSKRWDERVILDRVDLALEPGALVGLVGANGVGKTTLLRILAGLIYAASGTVTLDGLDVRNDERAYKARLGFVSAGQTGLYARLTVEQQLDYWARIAFVPRRSRPGAVARAIARFGLDELRRRRVDRLSMGQRQRVRLAMGFLHEPTLVLLDEPQTSLDPAGIQRLTETLTEFAAAGGTAIWCAPTDADIPLPLDRVLSLSEGRLTQV
jgi:ABC-2 type transport system ATP-binding protein